MADILLLDDELPLLQSLSLALRRAGHRSWIAENGRQALALLREQPMDLAVLDVYLPDMSGLDVLRRLRQTEPDVPVLMVTAFASVETAVEALKEGARDYLEKPLDLEELLLVVERELDHARLGFELQARRRSRCPPRTVNPLCGPSAAAQALRARVEEVVARLRQSPEPAAVLLEGEPGSGRRELARLLHDQWRTDGVFCAVACAGPAAALEDELFGREAGDRAPLRRGLLELCQGGSLLLEDVERLPLALQGQLSTALEEGRLRRPGGTRSVPLRACLLATAATPLAAAVAAGTFRADLAERLQAERLRLPPLRERREDLLELARRCAEQVAGAGAAPIELDGPVRRRLEQGLWPGNLRELEQAIEQLLRAPRGSTSGAAAEVLPEEPPSVLRFDVTEEDCTLEHVERRLIEQMLAATGGNVSAVARRLRLTRGALRHRMQKLGISA